MNLITWVSTEVVGGTLYCCEEAGEYEILLRDPATPEGAGGYFLRRLVADCDDIGPLATFKDAEDTLIKFMSMLVIFEEQAWRITAAKAIPPQPTEVDPVAERDYFPPQEAV